MGVFMSNRFDPRGYFRAPLRLCLRLCRMVFLQACLLATATGLHAAERVALVIGNSAYPTAPLDNPRHDANAMADLLTAAGFQVEKQLDTELAPMKAAVDRFALAIRDPQVKFALFYYAGHGLQQDSSNFLIPVSALIRGPNDVPKQTVDVSQLLGAMKQSQGRSFLVILDACRNDPFAGSFKRVTKGLSPVDAPSGSLVAYATQPGNVALDSGGKGRNGLYTGFLLEEFAVKGAKLEDVFKRVRVKVRMASKARQIPFESTSLEEDLQIFPVRARKLSEKELDQALEAEINDWSRIKSSSDPEALAAFINQYPSGSTSELAQSRLNRLLNDITERAAQFILEAQQVAARGAQELTLREDAARRRIAEVEQQILAEHFAELERIRIAKAQAAREELSRQQAELLAEQMAETARQNAQRAQAAEAELRRVAAVQAQAAKEAAEQARRVELAREEARRQDAARESARLAEVARVLAKAQELEAQQKREAAIAQAEAQRQSQIQSQLLAQAEQERARLAKAGAAREELERLQAAQAAAQLAETTRLNALRVRAAEEEELRKLAAVQAQAAKDAAAQQQRAELALAQAKQQEADKASARIAELARIEAQNLESERQLALKAAAERNEAARQSRLLAQAAQAEAERLQAEQQRHLALEQEKLLKAEQARLLQLRLAEQQQREANALYEERAALLASIASPPAQGGELPATPNFMGYAEHQRSYSIGDEAEIRVIDAFTKASKPLSMRVTQVDSSTERVTYNDGEFESDLMGNTTTNQRGSFSTPRQFYPAELIVGKKWSTRFKQTRPSGTSYTFKYDLKVVAKEKITVPAGTFEAFKIEARGFNMELSAALERNIWVVPGINADIAHEIKVRLSNGRWDQNDRQELVSYKQARQ